MVMAAPGLVVGVAPAAPAAAVGVVMGGAGVGGGAGRSGSCCGCWRPSSPSGERTTHSLNIAQYRATYTHKQLRLLMRVRCV